MEEWEDGQGNRITITENTITLKNGRYWDHIGVTEEKTYSYKKDGPRISVDVNKANGQPLEFVLTGVEEDTLRIQGEIHTPFRRV